MTLAQTSGPRVTADPIAALLLVVGGGAGILALLLSWLPANPRLPSGTVTGWEMFVIGQAQELPLAERVAVWAVLIGALAGGACVLLGLTTLLPIDHHPIGGIALLVSLGSLAGTAWWTAERSRTAGGIGPVIDQVQVGWWVATLAGVVCVIGAVRALSRG